MTTKKDGAKYGQNSDLRSQAEDLINSGRTFEGDQDSQALVHELQVHQIELEMQNEELKRAKAEAEDALAKYSDLYDFAPVGLFTLDPHGSIAEVNLAGASLLGFERRDLLNRSFRRFVEPGSRPSFDAFLSASFEAAVKQKCETAVRSCKGFLTYVQIEGRSSGDSPDKLCRIAVMDVTRRMLAEEELRKARDELTLRVHERTSELARSNEMLIAEIEERRRAEEIIITSLSEKEVLLREVHHRVKNNLQVISSLLYLQSKKAADDDTQEIFQDIQNRVKSIALVHEKLFRSGSKGRINMAEYTKSLVNHLFHCYDVHFDRISLKLDIEDTMIDVDTAVSFGLIINELVSNTLKHAFPDGRKGQIGIMLRPDGQNGFMLGVRDDGIGFREDPETASTLGLQLVNALVAQINGSMTLDSSQGARIEIAFRGPEYKERC